MTFFPAGAIAAQRDSYPDSPAIRAGSFRQNETPHMDQHVLQRIRRTFLFLVRPAAPSFAVLCPFAGGTPRTARNVSPQPPALPPATRSSEDRGATRIGHKFRTADAAANERTVYGVGPTVAWKNRKSHRLVRCFFDPIVRRLPFNVMRSP
jgi:hypothetical protein